MTKIGILHPGEMGISIASSAINNGHSVYWVSENRSDKSRLRAEEYKLTEIDSLAQLCKITEIILCICPPHAAENVARLVIEQKFRGYYLDANAISPQQSIKIGELTSANGIQFIDGGIIGGPAWKPKETYLYLSGEHAQIIANCFSNGPLGVKVIGNEIGKASALKMCYAAYSKGTTALLAAILAAAETYNVRDVLYQQWDKDDTSFKNQVEGRVKRVTAKAWRFEGEMLEIASTLHEAGLPSGFHEAAAKIYHCFADFKNAQSLPSIDEVLNCLSNKSSA